MRSRSTVTQGLIGNITFNGARDRIYYFYTDIIDGQNVTMRREMVDLQAVNWWQPPLRVQDTWMNVAYHTGRDRWAVFRIVGILRNLDGTSVCDSAPVPTWTASPACR